jgi:predicted ATPase
MKISRLRAQNFKSFDTVDVELGDLNVFIGANASGKSNFLSILTFLRDIARDGLEDAVSMQSGLIELLRNVQIGGEQPTDICVEMGHGLSDPGAPPEFGLQAGLRSESATMSGFRYELGLQHDESDFWIGEERVKWAGYFRESNEPSGDGAFDVRATDRESLKENGARSASNGTPIGKGSTFKTSLLQKESVWSILAREIFSRFRVFDFGSGRVGAEGASQKGRSQLEADGRNVALVLRRLLKNEEKRRKFLNLATALLPFVEDLDVVRFGGQSLLMTLQESHAEGQYLPSSLLSEGTIRVVALLVALYFENKRIMAFEEPTISLHPKLISQLMQMMKEVSEEKQVLITTHNPEVIRHVDLDDVYLVSRDEDGFSQISKPADKTEVRTFLENDLGIDDLFVQNLL